MPRTTGFSYQRLQNEDHNEHDYEDEIKKAIAHVKSKIRRTSRLKRVHMKKKLKMKIPSLRKFFMRMRSRVIMASMSKVVKRLKESQSHFGDLFAGNYLFMQVNPGPVKTTSPYAISGSVKRVEDGLRCS
ncbi:hypothetical protein Tco_0894759 [Tanacetum coccineum]|uniref:Uncharacterized protein n=1 Tax=Tanacetum coccineum TaxID=301880 RepID=A0ABQ5CF26_9ASTR